VRARIARRKISFLRCVSARLPAAESSLAKNAHVAAGAPDTKAVKAATDSTP
jgi:hypothetical protein